MAPPMLAHHQLDQAAKTAEDLIGCNDKQRFLMANTTPEQDCLVDDYRVMQATLRARGIDADTLLAGFLTRLRQIIELNDHEYHGERRIVGTLTSLAGAARTAERTTPEGALTIRALRQALVAPLGVFADPHAERAALYHAFRQIDTAIRGVPADRLVNGSLRAQLGHGPHDQLLALIGAAVPA